MKNRIILQSLLNFWMSAVNQKALSDFYWISHLKICFWIHLQTGESFHMRMIKEAKMIFTRFCNIIPEAAALLCVGLKTDVQYLRLIWRRSYTIQQLMRGLTVTHKQCYFSFSFVLISLYNCVFLGNLFSKGTSDDPILIIPWPASTFEIKPLL